MAWSAAKHDVAQEIKSGVVDNTDNHMHRMGGKMAYELVAHDAVEGEEVQTLVLIAGGLCAVEAVNAVAWS